MTNLLDDCRHTVLEERAYAEAECLFAEYLKLFPVSREAVDRLERNLLKLALAAQLATSESAKNIIQTDAGVFWHRDVELMDNIFLCHRPVAGRTEYAAVEHFLANGTNEIWNRGWEAIQVLKIFAKEQRQALEFGTKDMVARTMEFLAKKYSSQDLSCLTSSFNRQFNETASPWSEPTYEQNRAVAMVAEA